MRRTRSLLQPPLIQRLAELGVPGCLHYVQLASHCWTRQIKHESTNIPLDRPWKTASTPASCIVPRPLLQPCSSVSVGFMTSQEIGLSGGLSGMTPEMYQIATYITTNRTVPHPPASTDVQENSTGQPTSPSSLPLSTSSTTQPPPPGSPNARKHKALFRLFKKLFSLTGSITAVVGLLFRLALFTGMYCMTFSGDGSDISSYHRYTSPAGSTASSKSTSSSSPSTTLGSITQQKMDEMPPPSPISSYPWLSVDMRNRLRFLRTLLTVIAITIEYNLSFSQSEKELERWEMMQEWAKAQLLRHKSSTSSTFPPNVHQQDDLGPEGGDQEDMKVDQVETKVSQEEKKELIELAESILRMPKPKWSPKWWEDMKSTLLGTVAEDRADTIRKRSTYRRVLSKLTGREIPLSARTGGIPMTDDSHDVGRKAGLSPKKTQVPDFQPQSAIPTVPATKGGPGEQVLAHRDPTGSTRRQEQLANLHSRCAHRLLKLAQEQGGAYVKAAQHIVSMSHSIPLQYSQVLSVLHDRAVPQPWDDVVRVLQEELGCSHPDDLFAEFSREPIAAASLAQVHRAITKDGQEVAVKVQYNYLRDITSMDIATVHTLTRMLSGLFPTFGSLSWLADQFEEHMGQELDFVHEGASGTRIRALFTKDSHIPKNATGDYYNTPEASHRRLEIASKTGIYIPEVRWDLTSKRVITTEFINGCRITDVAAITKMGLDPLKIFDEFGKSFGEMVFSFGFVHCDPHPGNALVRVRPSLPYTPIAPLSAWSASMCGSQSRQELDWFSYLLTSPFAAVDAVINCVYQACHYVTETMTPKEQVVLLDHGLYRELNPNFRVSFAKLWRHMFARDDAGLKEEATNLGMGKVWKLLPVILIFRMPGSKRSLTGAWTEEEKQRFVKEFGKAQFSEIVNFVGSLPPDLVFVLKTLNLVRSVNRDLGGTTARRLLIFFRSAVVGALTPSLPEDSDLKAVEIMAPHVPGGQALVDVRPPVKMAFSTALLSWWDQLRLNLWFYIFENFLSGGAMDPPSDPLSDPSPPSRPNPPPRPYNRRMGEAQ